MLSTLRARLVIVLLLVSFIPALLLGGLLATRSQSAISEQSKAQIVMSAREKRESLRIELHSLQIVVETLSHTPSVKNAHAQQVEALFEGLLTTKHGIDAAFLIDMKGMSHINSSKTTMDMSYYSFLSKAQSGQNVISEVMVSPYSGKPVIIVAAPVVTGGSVTAVFGLSFELSAIEELMTSQTLGSTGEFYLINSSGYMLTPSRFIENSVLKQKMFGFPMSVFESKGSVTGTYTDYRGEPVIGAIEYIPETNWGLVGKLDKSEAESLQRELTRLTLWVSGILLVLAIVTASAVAANLSEPIQHVATMAQKTAEGQFDFSLDEYRGLTEVVSLHTAVRSMGIAVRALLTKLGAAATELDTSVHVLTGSAQAIAAHLAVHSSISTEITQHVNNTAISSQGMVERSQDALEVAKAAAVLATVGEKGVSQALGYLHNIQVAVEDLEASSQQVTDVNNALANIADRTNVLALNAAVEAARAGGHGLSFGVVAKEVRNLSEHAKEATMKSHALLSGITSRIAAISTLARGSMEGASATSESVGNMLSGTEKVAQILDELATVARDQADAMQQAAKGVEDFSVVSTSISKSAQSLTNTAEHLGLLSGNLKNEIEIYS